MASNNLIETLNVSYGDVETKNLKKKKRDARFDPVDDKKTDPATLINTLNEANVSLADFILNDTSENKIETFRMLSVHSSMAKSILKNLEEQNETLPLTTMRATNLLRFLTNVYEDSLQI
ncbi:p12 [Sucra jujuba nucleopolyhedrovirus]|uniref:p12 n=1 Tax=Sucra jujuba nucleopolyhedrovirus TaxID=1563660 RepID=A0A097P947_9ABAC|nr:p12 [Sucra jujuba nucleopolyhedrovirus]AIU41324.1 p12 [Sucra jujuba nucleopolyhedrovirus]